MFKTYFFISVLLRLPFAIQILERGQRILTPQVEEVEGRCMKEISMDTPSEEKYYVETLCTHSGQLSDGETMSRKLKMRGLSILLW